MRQYLHSTTEPIASCRLVLNTGKGTYFFSPEQIIRMEAKSNYTTIYFLDRKPILTAKVLKDYEEILEPFGFVRTHRSHLVNKRYIVFVDDNSNIVMQDTSKAGISRRKKTGVMKALSAA
jgi:two-component system, LytTR family, response regulator